MANEVVLGDLALDSRDDCLKFDGNYPEFSQGHFSTTNEDFTVEFVITVSAEGLGGAFIFCEHMGGSAYGLNVYGTGDWGIGTGTLSVFGASGLWALSNLSADVEYTVRYEKVGTTVKTYVDDTLKFTNNNVTFPSGSFNGVVKVLGGRKTVAGGSGGFGFVGQLSKFEYTDPHNSSHNISLAFTYGATQLVDVANGDNATLDGATWWKKDVDETYSTEQLYKSSWANPMDEDQRVVDQLGNYRYDNAFWNPYNQDATYSFDLINGIKNEVVLGDLALDSRDDCLRFDGVTGKLLTPCVINSDHKITIRFVYEGFTGSLGYVLRASNDFNTGIYLYVQVDSLRYNIGDGSGLKGVTHSTRLVVGNTYEVVAEAIGNYMTLTINGTTMSYNHPSVMYNSDPVSLMGRSNDNSVNVKGVVNDYNISINGSTCSEFPAGDWGDITLPDGATLTGGVQWWKKDVDENYATSQLFKSTLTSPLTEDQHVVYTDAEPYYASDDVFWNPFNQDVNFDFTVAPLGGTGSIGIAGLNSLNISMTISF